MQRTVYFLYETVIAAVTCISLDEIQESRGNAIIIIKTPAPANGPVTCDGHQSTLQGPESGPWIQTSSSLMPTGNPVGNATLGYIIDMILTGRLYTPCETD